MALGTEWRSCHSRPTLPKSTGQGSGCLAFPYKVETLSAKAIKRSTLGPRCAPLGQRDTGEVIFSNMGKQAPSLPTEVKVMWMEGNFPLGASSCPLNLTSHFLFLNSISSYHPAEINLGQRHLVVYIIRIITYLPLLPTLWGHLAYQKIGPIPHTIHQDEWQMDQKYKCKKWNYTSIRRKYG